MSTLMNYGFIILDLALISLTMNILIAMVFMQVFLCKTALKFIVEFFERKK